MNDTPLKYWRGIFLDNPDRKATLMDTPLLQHKNELSFSLKHPPNSVEEQQQFWNAMATSFRVLFRCNPNKFYVRLDNGDFTARARAVTNEDWLAHLWNMPDSDLVLSPICENNQVYWAGIDIDRHGEEQEAVKWDVLARLVTELRLPLVVTESGGGMGAHLFCFFRERETGIPAADAIRLMKHYVKLLGLPERTEIFPKQAETKNVGNGLNVPYHYRKGPPGYAASNPVAYDAEGNQIEHWEDFLTFAWQRSKFGNLLLRDLPVSDGTSATATQIKISTAADRPIKAAEAREQYARNLEALRNAPLDGQGNDLLFKTAAYAGNVLKALGKGQEGIKSELLQIVCHEWKSPHNETKASATIDSGLTKGISEPRAIVLPPVLPWCNSRAAVTSIKSPAIIDHMIYAAALTGLIGRVKLGKTTLALDACECIVMGRSFLKEPVMSGSVLYVSEQPLGSFVAELNNSGLVETGQIVLGSPPPLGEFEYVCIEHWFKYTWKEIVEATLARAVEIGAKLVCFDTLSRIARVENENDASETQRAIDELTPFLQAGIAVLFVAHERKSGGDIQDASRGSSAIVGSVDVILRLVKPTGNHPESYRQLDFVGRFPAPSAPKVLDRKTADSSSRYELLGNVAAVRGATVARTIYALFEDPEDEFSLDELVEETGANKSTVRRAVLKHLEHGSLVQSGTGKKDSPYRYKIGKTPL
jgi:hypothetical protein